MNTFIIKAKTLVLALFCFGIMPNLQAQTKKALFIGNSYTAFNNLPQLTYNVALSVGDTLIYDAHTPGGQRFLNHAVNATALAKISDNDWDFVALQGQSQETAFPDFQLEDEVLPYAQALCDSIRANNTCSMPVFYMTWGRKNGDASNCPFAPWFCTYEGMDSVINQNYRRMANENEALVSPVGAAWHYIRDNHPSLELYNADESHPSPLGSYAAACCFYTIFFEKDPTLITYDFSLSGADAEMVRAAVKAVVFDNLAEWNVGAFNPMAQFDFLPAGTIVNFNNTSTHANEYLWDFGDGNTSTQANPSHTYLADGDYQVSLTAQRCGISSTVQQTLNMTTLGVENTMQNRFMLYPNPVDGMLTIDDVGNEKIKAFSIFDSSGREILNSKGNKQTHLDIDLSALKTGVYFLQIQYAKGRTFTEKIVKE